MTKAELYIDSFIGQKTLLAEIVIKSAYRIVQVHTHDRPLLGMHIA